MNKQVLIRFEGGLLEDIHPHGRESFGDRRCLNETEPRRHPKHLHGRNRDIFGMASTDEQRANLLSDSPIDDSVPKLCHFPRHFESQNVRHSSG
ncbi:hypothetical protein D9M68_768390 [compost metagenome]